MSTLIQDSVKSLQTSVGVLRETVNNFQGHLTAAESLTGENFKRLATTETTVKLLQAQNKALKDRLGNLENRFRRISLCIINMPEGSETGQDPIKFISDLLMERLGLRARESTSLPCLQTQTGRYPQTFCKYVFIIFKRKKKYFARLGNAILSTGEQRYKCTLI